MTVSIKVAVCVNGLALLHTVRLPINDDRLRLSCLWGRWWLSIAWWVTALSDFVLISVGQSAVFIVWILNGNEWARKTPNQLIINNFLSTSFHYLHKMISSTMKMRAMMPTIAARIGMSYSLVDCLNNGWIDSQFGCIVICGAWRIRELIYFPW